MTIAIRSKDDQRLVGHLRKKSKKKKINVYFNKRDSKSGKTKYVQGKFVSEKNQATFAYKSSYELAYLNLLEKDDNVFSYTYEPFDLNYFDSENKQRIYKPDFMVLYKDGRIEVTEVKPKLMLQDYDVKAKAAACRIFLEENYKDIDISYRFITEKVLFKTSKEYTDFIKSIKE